MVVREYSVVVAPTDDATVPERRHDRGRGRDQGRQERRRQGGRRGLDGRRMRPYGSRPPPPRPRRRRQASRLRRRRRRRHRIGHGGHHATTIETLAVRRGDEPRRRRRRRRRRPRRRRRQLGEASRRLLGLECGERIGRGEAARHGGGGGVKPMRGRAGILLLFAFLEHCK